MNYHQISKNSDTTEITCGAGTAYPSRAHDFIVGLCGVHVARSLVFCVMFCIALFVFCSFSLSHCFTCPLIFRFWFPLWYLNTI